MSYWICQGAGWGIYTLIKLLAAVYVAHLPWISTTVVMSLLSAAGLALTHRLRGFMRRHSWHAPGTPRLAWRALAASGVLALPLGVATTLSPLSQLSIPEWSVAQSITAFHVNLVPALAFAVNWINWVFLVAAWLGIYFAAQTVRHHQTVALRQSETARALQQAELRLLKSQLNPHFLFNALNTVRCLITEDPAKAQRAVTRLANTLRYTLRADQDELVSFASEMDVVNDFLELELLRFEDRLTVERVVAVNAGTARLPALLLQTVVENAIKHGVAELPAGGTVGICAEMSDGVLVLEVQNPRPRAPGKPVGAGTGLRNSQERLRLLFDSRASLELDLSDPVRATTRIRIPQQS